MNRRSNDARSQLCDFTLPGWRQILRAARPHYPTRTFTDFGGEDTFVLWRHDVDFSPQRALRMAQIEAEEGVRATYFIHFHNAFYNALEPSVVDVFGKVLDLGHALGLHFDCAFYGLSRSAEFEKMLRVEKDFLKRTFGNKVTAFSLHNPSSLFLDRFRGARYCGMANAYSDFFRTQVGYSSDSNGYWRYEPMEEVILSRKHKRLQLLTHPAWWQDVVMSPKERIRRCIDGRSRRTAEWYDATLAQFGRENVDW